MNCHYQRPGLARGICFFNNHAPAGPALRSVENHSPPFGFAQGGLRHGVHGVSSIRGKLSSSFKSFIPTEDLSPSGGTCCSVHSPELATFGEKRRARVPHPFARVSRKGGRRR